MIANDVKQLAGKRPSILRTHNAKNPQKRTNTMSFDARIDMRPSSREGYRQCTLRRGNVVQVSHIPAKYAYVGDTLKLKNDSGAWVDGWLVESASELQPSARVESDERLYRRTRRASDI